MSSDWQEAWEPVQAFAAASRLLDQAAGARQELFECWSALTGSGAFDCELIGDSDSTGHLDVTLVWPPALADRAEAAADRFGRLVKEALDIAFGAVARRPGASGATPSDGLPLCQTRAEFEEVREAGVLRRLRPDQLQLVEAVQPYHGLPGGDEDAADVGRAMRQLAAMLAPRDQATQRVAVWATNIRPEYLTQHPDSWVNSEPLGEGLLVDRLTIDHFVCGGVTPDQLRPDPKVGYLFVFNDGPPPADVNDGLSQRTNHLLLIARTFSRMMSRSTDLDELRRAAGGPVQDRVPVEPAALWGDVDFAAMPDGPDIARSMERSDTGIGTLTDPDGAVSVLVESGGQVFSRPLPPALPLAAELAVGIAAEQASLQAAASWGLPDFVFNPKVVDKGNSSRELGDGTVIVGDRALAIQVKARAATGDTPERAVNWLRKMAHEGGRQATGTIRALTRQPVELIDGRGRASIVARSELDWVRVVILEHPDSPSVELDADDQGAPLVPILRRDWEFLFDHLRSTATVVDYIFRVAREPTHHVGQEPARYFELAREDAKSANRDSESWPAGLGAEPSTYPLLPTAPPTHADVRGHSMYRLILEEIAEAESPVDDDGRRRILAQLDRYPVAERAELGGLLLAQLDDVRVGPDSSMWRFRRLILDSGRLHLAFGTCSTFSDLHREAFRRYAMVRHYEIGEALEPYDAQALLTIAVLLTPRYDSARLWDTTLFGLEGGLDLTQEEVDELHVLWPRRGSDGRLER